MSETKTARNPHPEVLVLPGRRSLATTLRGLTDVMLDEEYHDSFCRPMRDAFEAVWNLLVAADEVTASGVPATVTAPVGAGGVLCEWEQGSRRVFLAVPADPAEGYIYRRGPDSRSTVRELSGATLASALTWLIGE